jgi:flagellar hook assembly protein FlgD
VVAGGQRLQVSQAWPAPFTSETRIALRLEETTDVRVEVFDVAGRLVRTLYEGALGAGVHDMIWDGRRYGGGEAPPGVYFVRCSGQQCREVRPVVLVR